MNKQEATNFVIRELGKNRQRNDIIENLCTAAGISWGDAEKFVQQVEMENKSAIALKQSPLITIIGLGTAILGVVMAARMVIATLQGVSIFFLGYPVPYLGNIVYFLTGLTMILAGLWGIWDTLAKIWNS
jgi:hypothetical protein